MAPASPIPRRRRSPAVQALPRPGGWRLQAECGWVVESSREWCDQVEAALPRVVCERLADRLLLLSFGNHVGRYRAGPLGTLEVYSGKWGDADYDQLLERISEEAAALPFDAGTPSALPFDRSMLGSRDVLYHAFTYLRHVVGPTVSRERALLPILQGIVRRPHRRFQRVGREVPLELALRVEPRVMQDVLCGRWPLERVRGSQGPLAVALQGHRPTHIEESVATDLLDTAENRFVKCFLDISLGVVDLMRTRASTANRPESWRKSVLTGCADIERALRPVRQHMMWREVGPMVHFPASSTVLQRRHEYRELFQHYNRLRLGSRLPLDTELAEQLLEVKNIALLYELWSCFALVRAVKAVLGEPESAGRLKSDDLGLGLGWEYSVHWSNGVRVLYNPSFSRARAGLRRSYSVPLRPDLLLEVPRGEGCELHVLDAKFKVEWLDGAMPSTEEKDEEEKNRRREREGTFKRADIYKMHAYRDALPAVRSAWVLYPGTRMRFFARCGSGGGVEHVEDLPRVLEGVGAAPLPSDGVGVEMIEVVRRLLGSGKRAAQGHRSALRR